ncbi:hypothetical protein GCM10020358_60790 [Amorphoplanes nipponensis]|uniref:Uncharacterized protein n=1 Tax=Actinoplanes nipponensis TaxID=135950 RepID=A0A919MR94_9ACTN|nr:hypothetical protein [Actinoplanes nipponensis]GIE54426.1 hypothetical protein Ani05nite_79600 [Actinoplanes nipponensis]
MTAPATRSPGRLALRRNQRSMPPARMLTQGMDFTDVFELQERTGAGEDWSATLVELGDRQSARAAAAAARAHPATAAEAFLLAAACYRCAHSTLIRDDEQMRDLFGRSAAAFARAMALRRPAGERIMIEGWVHGWRLRGSAGGTAPACVVVLGGNTGWAESHETSARHLLARGLDVVLADIPGQGGVRLVDGVPFRDDEQQVEALRRVVAAARRYGYQRIGILGHSAGAYWAALGAARIAAIDAACCVSGSDVPGAPVVRFASGAHVFGAMCGLTDAAAAQARAAAWRWPEDARVDRPTLLLHGGKDLIYPLGHAGQLAGRVRPGLAETVVFARGGHCLYEIQSEKMACLADWLHDRLG